MSVQGDYKDRFISVEYITKKGKKIAQSVKFLWEERLDNQLLEKKED